MFAIKPVGDPCCDPPLVGNTLNYSLACLGGSCIVAFAECHEKLHVVLYVLEEGFPMGHLD